LFIGGSFFYYKQRQEPNEKRRDSAFSAPETKDSAIPVGAQAAVEPLIDKAKFDELHRCFIALKKVASGQNLGIGDKDPSKYHLELAIAKNSIKTESEAKCFAAYEDYYNTFTLLTLIRRSHEEMDKLIEDDPLRKFSGDTLELLGPDMKKEIEQQKKTFEEMKYMKSKGYCCFGSKSLGHELRALVKRYNLPLTELETTNWIPPDSETILQRENMEALKTVTEMMDGIEQPSP